MAVSVDHAAPARTAARRALKQADALLGDLEEFESESGVIKLIDDVFTLEERLLRRLRMKPA